MDLYNGHVTLTIPIGPKYPVSERFSYGLTLTYNSNIWAYESVPASDSQWCTSAQLRRSADFDWNAGAGFLLSLGELRYRNFGGGWIEWTYLSPDGAEHKFYDKLRDGDSEPANDVYYTQDGSYLRLTWNPNALPRLAVVEFPDGSRHTFGEYASGKYRLLRMTDSVKSGTTYPNWVSVSYYSNPTRVVLSDRLGRSQTLYFATDTSAVPATFVSYVLLQAPGGKTLRYDFTYEVRPIKRSCKADCSAYGLETPTVNARFLKSVVVSDATVTPWVELELWEFPEYYWLTSGCEVDYGDGGGTRYVKDLSGVLKTYRLPTRGEVTFQWDDKLFFHMVEWPSCPPSGNPERCLPNIVYQTSTAVIRKQRNDPFQPSASGTFQYRFANHETWYSGGSRIREFSDELVTIVRDPQGNETAHFFAPGVNDQGLEHQWYGGLGFTRLQTDSQGHYLARKVFRGTAEVDCPSGPGNHCEVYPSPGSALLRAEYVLYENDYGGGTGDGGNRRLRNSRTYFADDPQGCTPPTSSGVGTCYWSGVVRSDFDGYGHYRQEEVQSNFPNAVSRTTFTRYNPTNPLPWLLTNWVINTYDLRRTSEGGNTRTEETCFNGANGLLLRQRVYASLFDQRQANDVVTAFAYDASGNLVEEAIYGGDGQALSTDPYTDLCNLALPAPPQYRKTHQYQWGVRSRSAFVDPASGTELLVTLDLTPDPATGLAAAVRDSAGMETTYEYDALGRVVWVRPQRSTAGTPGGGWTQVQYQPATAETMARVRVSTCAYGTTDCAGASSPLARQTYDFSGFGQLRYHWRLIPQEGSDLAFRRTDYNAMGWKIFESEWHRGDEAISSGTRWLSFDPLGRPLQVQGPDGKVTSFAYTGARRVSRTVSVATSSASEEEVTVYEDYDNLGRLVQVEEPSGPSGARVVTTYAYNVLDKMKQAQTTSGSVTQTRLWQYDGRGFMTSETLPEKGLYGNGTVSYQSFDPLGNAGRVVDGPNDLSFTYDKAARLIEVKETTSGRVLKAFTYATANAGSDMRKGKLVEAVANNYFDPANPSANFQVVEQYQYAGAGGNVSQKTTTVGVVGGYVGTFTQTFGWNDLWQLAWESYPVMAGLPGRTISYDYTYGFLTAVREGATTYA
ncbi:MAG: RHS repeat domain-containing protein, partial [Thermoanaerobaculum sp.]